MKQQLNKESAVNLRESGRGYLEGHAGRKGEGGKYKMISKIKELVKILNIYIYVSKEIWSFLPSFLLSLITYLVAFNKETSIIKMSLERE